LFDRLVVPAQARRNTRLPLRMIIRSRRPTRARLRIRHNDRPIEIRDDIVELAGGMRPEALPEIPILVTSGGVHRFEARIEPLDPAADTLPQNNVASAFTVVEDRGKVLLLTNEEQGLEDNRPLLEALQREKVEVEMSTPGRMAVDLLALQEYGAVILANISADRFTEEQKQGLAAYVRDIGGGLILTGGEQSFGAGGWIGSPIEEISPVDFEVKHKKVIPRGALVIIMHSCEIPRGNYWGEQVAIASVKTISSLDYIGVLAYSWSPGGVNWEVPLQPATNKNAIISKIKQIKIGDMPDFATTMEMAVKGLLGLSGVAQRHVIIISDGDPSPPGNATLRRMVDNQITCSTVGIGYGQHVMESTLRQIAEATGGRFYACKNPNQLPQIFVKESKVVRRSLIDEQAFEPKLVYGLAETVRGFGNITFPVLKGLVLTTPKPAAIEMPLVRSGGDGDDPLMAQWQYELGKVLVFTSGRWTSWGESWKSWNRFGAFWAQVVRWAMRASGSSEFDVVTRLEGDRGRVVIEALRQDASFLNNMTFDPRFSRVVTPDLTAKPIRPVQTGPGRYEATFDVKDNGNYLVSLKYDAPNHEGGILRTGLTMPYSPEYRELSANLPLMEQVRSATGGRMLTMDPLMDDLFHYKRPITLSRRPIWREMVLWALLPLFLLDVAGRRLASALALSIYAEATILAVLLGVCITAHASGWACVGAIILAEIVGWTIRRDYILPAIRFFTHSVWALGRAGQRSTEALAQLRTARNRVRSEMAEPQRRAEGKTEDEQGPIPLEPAPDRGARFDVGDRKAAEAAGDLTEALGGAKPDAMPAGGGRPGGKAKGQAASQTELTARLLKAKRRAQQDMDARKEKGE
ncbi:MAG: VWA domain-containing protein, partial [Phycisphaerae bacterium]